MLRAQAVHHKATAVKRIAGAMFQFRLPHRTNPASGQRPEEGVEKAARKALREKAKRLKPKAKPQGHKCPFRGSAIDSM